MSATQAPAPLPSLTLVLGGQRSGKSAHAEDLIHGVIAETGGAVYLATALAGDEEMTARIKQHRERRDEKWQTVEAPFAIAHALEGLADCTKPVLVDSLGMWVANELEAGRDPLAGALIDDLAKAMAAHPAPVVVVSDETGLGVVPVSDMARKFVDALGTLNQSVAAAADRVVLVTAGLAQVLK